MKKISEHSDRELLEKIALNAKEANDKAGWIKGYIIITSIIGLLLLLMTLLSGCAEDPDPKFCWNCFVTTTIDPGAGAQTVYSGQENVCDKTQSQITELSESRTYNYSATVDGESILISVHTSCIKDDQ